MRILTANRRCGSLMFEVVMALAVLGAVFAVAAQSTVLFGVQQRRSWQTLVAAQEAANALQRVQAAAKGKDLTELDGSSFEPIKLSSAAQRQLSGGALRLKLEHIDATDTQNTGAMQVWATVHWTSSGGQPQSVTLTDWLFPAPKTADETHDGSRLQ